MGKVRLFARAGKKRDWIVENLYKTPETGVEIQCE
jgi:hypothetical protein